MGRVVAVLLLSLSLTAAAQTASPSSTSTTTTIPARVNLDPAVPVPSATTPLNVLTQPAAPGDTPVVVPDYSVATPLVPSGPPAEAIAASPSAASAAEAAPATGFVAYAAAPAPTTPAITVADAAAKYQAGKAGMKSRVIDNNSLATLDRNPSGLVTANEMTMPQSDLTPEEEASLSHAKPEHAAAGDVLDPRDLAAVEAAVRRSEQAQLEAQPAAEPATATASTAPAAQYEEMTRAAESQEPTAPAGDSSASPEPSADAQPQSRDRLPESGSSLPLLGLMGALAVGGAGFSLWRARG